MILDTLLERKCPCCGGAVRFDTGSQKLKCPYCDAEFDIEATSQNDANADLPEVEQIEWNSDNNDWAAGETDGMKVYGCNSCGGEIVADETTGATSCPYCGNPVVMKGQFEGALRPNLVIPFKYDKKAAKEALKRHIATKKFVPKAFKDENHLDEIKGVYVPHWLFTCDAQTGINYKAQSVRSWSDNNYIYTETSHFNVFRGGNLSFDNIPVDGSTKMPDDLMESIEPFNINEAVDFNTAYLAGYLADKYDVDAETSIERANERIKNSAADAFRDTVQGYTSVVTENMNLNIANGTYRYALYPVWILNTDWNGKKYTFAMNGQTGKFVGDIPTDNKRINKLSLLYGAALGVAIYAVRWLIELL